MSPPPPALRLLPLGGEVGDVGERDAGRHALAADLDDAHVGDDLRLGVARVDHEREHDEDDADEDPDEEDAQDPERSPCRRCSSA